MGAIEVFLDLAQSSNFGLRPWHGEGEWLSESAPNDWGVSYYEILFREKDMWRVVIFKSKKAPERVPADARTLIESTEYELCVKYILCSLYSEWRLSRSWDLIHWFLQDELAPGWSIHRLDEEYATLLRPDGSPIPMRHCVTFGDTRLRLLSYLADASVREVNASLADFWGRPLLEKKLVETRYHGHASFAAQSVPRMRFPAVMSDDEAEEFLTFLFETVSAYGLPVSSSEDGRTRKLLYQEGQWGYSWNELCGVYQIGALSHEARASRNKVAVSDNRFFASGDKEIALRVLALVVGHRLRQERGFETWIFENTFPAGGFNPVEYQGYAKTSPEARWTLKDEERRTVDAYMTDLLYVKPFTNKFPTILSHLLFRDPREILDALLDPDSTWQDFISENDKEATSLSTQV